MTNELYYPKDNRLKLVFKALVFFLVGIYLLNCISPLRLHVDTLRYYAIKDCIESGCPPDSVAAQDYLPYGYTALMLILSKIGLLKSFTIILINCIYLFASLYLINKIFKPYISPVIFAAAVLLNWTTIKFATHPLSEMQYLFFSVCSLYYFHRYTLGKKFLLLIPAFGFGALAFLTRSVGVTLFAALFAGVAWEYRQQIATLIRKHRILIVIVLLLFAGVIVFSKQLGLNHYTGVLNKQFDEGAAYSKILGWHFKEWTEITLNLSVARVETVIGASTAQMIFIALGVLCFIAAIYLVFVRKNQIPFIIKAYLAFYTLLMFNWPFYDPRFWVPVVPLFLAAFSAVFPGKASFQKLALSVYGIGYGLVGLAAIGYYTYTSLNKELLAKKQANGVYRNEYETHFFGKPLSDTAKTVNAEYLHVLERHD